jgi:hypothetical protein
MRVELHIGPEGKIELPSREVEALGIADGAQVELFTASGAYAIISPIQGNRAYFAGSISVLTVPEVIQSVIASLKSGVLLLRFGNEVERADRAHADQPRQIRRKTIYFREGQVVFASSSDIWDRLGAVLARLGQVPADELERCGRLVKSGRPLGQVLVDEKVLTPAQLYQAVTHQVREILLGTFLEDEGEFSFLEGAHDERNAVKLPERTRELLLQGVKRREEVERILAGDVPDLDAPLAWGPAHGGEVSQLEANALRLLEQVDGTRTVRAALEESGLGTYHGLKVAASLIQAGVLAPIPPRPEEEQPALTPAPMRVASAEAGEAMDQGNTGPFETYRRIFKRIYLPLVNAQPGALERLNNYFERLPENRRFVFEGVRMSDQGELDVAQVFRNVAASGLYKGAAARARALEALEDYLAYALFEAKNILPRAEAESLLRDVGRMQMGKG